MKLLDLVSKEGSFVINLSEEAYKKTSVRALIGSCNPYGVSTCCGAYELGGFLHLKMAHLDYYLIPRECKQIIVDAIANIILYRTNQVPNKMYVAHVLTDTQPFYIEAFKQVGWTSMGKWINPVTHNELESFYYVDRLTNGGTK